MRINIFKVKSWGEKTGICSIGSDSVLTGNVISSKLREFYLQIFVRYKRCIICDNNDELSQIIFSDLYRAHKS